MDNKNPFNLDFMDDYYDNLMEQKMNSQTDPFNSYNTDSRFSLDGILGSGLKDFERDQANAFIDSYYMEEYDEMEKEFMAKLMEPEVIEKPKYDYRKIKHLRDFKNMDKDWF